MREFRQKHGRGEARYWQIWVEGSTVYTRWGGIKPDGSLRQHGETSDIAKPKGKKGTKSWKSSAESASFQADRAIRLKTEEGYYEVNESGEPLTGATVGELNLLSPELPKNLCFSKPKNSVSEAFARKREDRLIFTRKRHGMSLISYIACEGIRLYTRRMEDRTGHFPQLMSALESFGWPPGTIMLWEAFCGDGNTQDEFEAVKSVMNSKPGRAVKLQETDTPVKFYLFRIPVWDGTYLERTQSVDRCVEQIENTFTDLFLDYGGCPYFDRGEFLHALQVFNGTIDGAMALCNRENYEGWVVYVAGESMGDKSFGFHGTPDRPACCFKLKPQREDDFICQWDPSGEFGRHCAKGCQYDTLMQIKEAHKTRKCPKCGARMVGNGTWGSGKHKEAVGTLSLYQLDRKGVPVYICEVGTGLSDQQRAKLADATLFPRVAEVEFQSRSYSKGSGKPNTLYIPRVKRFRDDKEPSECVNDRL
jgi:hypothetical protein